MHNAAPVINSCFTVRSSYCLPPVCFFMSSNVIHTRAKDNICMCKPALCLSPWSIIIPLNWIQRGRDYQKSLLLHHFSSEARSAQTPRSRGCKADISSQH
ncbi:hypothetical protein ILYODFUR_008921 [Ilyodon furcidens]|uniref:Uncharacterized protein n=1 Tax=Ilyodon furcidens TaxID=33524 RepID=A0ABV0SJP5_9TELE